MMLLLAAATWWQSLIVQLVAFALLAILLGKLAVPGLKKILADRTKGVEDGFSKLEAQAASAQKELAAIREKLAGFEVEAKRRSDAAAAEAASTRAAVLAEAERQAQAILDKAKREMETERDKAALELAERAVELIRGAAEEAAKASMTDEAHRRRVDDYIAKVETLRRP